MSEAFDVGRDPTAALDAAERAVGDGRLVVFPTDTVYGVGGRPDLPGATARIFEAKQRPPRLTLPVLAAGMDQAAEVAVFDRRARGLAERFWPGAVTLVLPRAEASREWDLGAERDTVGVRVPGHETALGLLRRTGPLAVTSANRSGEPTPATCRDVREALGEAVAVYLCADASVAGDTASTVVDLTGSPPRVLREGAVPAADVLAAL
ncbi:MAG: L-threonylcarbamoyladenylate synthase [Actinomycetota bacterium]